MCLFNCKSRTVSPPDFYSLAGDRPKQGNSTPAATIPDNSAQGNPTAAAAIPDTPTQGNPTPEKKRPASQSNSHGESDKKSTDEAVQKPENGARVSGHKVQGKYSIKFKIIDQTGKICNGMYYSVKVIGTKELYNSGTTDANGETEIFYSDIADKAYLYIGHRIEKFEDLPTSRSTPEQISDECNLNNGGDQQITMTPHEENKPPITVQTQRLWKPWTVTPRYKEALKGMEGFITNPYLDSEGNATVGIGHLIHQGGFIMNDNKIDTVIKLIQSNYPTEKISAVTIKGHLKEALGLSGKTLEKAQNEMDFVDELTEQETIDLMNKDITSHVHYIKIQVHVPLFQYEYETLADLCFNGGGGALQKNNSKIAPILNTGKYSAVPAGIDDWYFHRKKTQKNIWNNKYPNDKYEVHTHKGPFAWTPLGKR